MTQSQTATVGVDIGTTSVSVAVVDLTSGANRYVETAAHQATLPPDVPGANLQDPARLLHVTEELIARALTQQPEITAIGVTGQMHGVLPVDARGRPTGPAYTWLDARATNALEAMRSELGTTAPPGYGAATLFALTRSGKLPPETEFVTSVPAWVAGRLANVTCCPSSPGLAHSLGFFSPERRAFDTGQWERISPLPPPAVGTDASFIGESRSGLPICVPEGDNQASYLATVRDPERAVSFNVGTSGQVSVLQPSGSVPNDAAPMEARPFPGGRTLLVGTTLSAGKSFEILERLVWDVVGLNGGTVPDVLAILAGRPRPADVPRVIPTFAGTRANADLRGSISDISVDNFSLVQLYWGIARGVIDELWETAGCHLSVLDAPNSYATASGNALAKSQPLQTELAERVGRPVRWPEEAEAAARGAALLAAAALAGGPDALPELQQRTIKYR